HRGRQGLPGGGGGAGGRGGDAWCSAGGCGGAIGRLEAVWAHRCDGQPSDGDEAEGEGAGGCSGGGGVVCALAFLPWREVTNSGSLSPVLRGEGWGEGR